MNARCMSLVVLGTVLGILSVLVGCAPTAQNGLAKLTDVLGAAATSASLNTNAGAAAQPADEPNQAGDSEDGQTGEFEGEHQVGPDDPNDAEADDGASSLVLEAGASSAALQAEVKYEQETNGTSFDVKIVGGQPGASVDVTFAGQVLVSIPLDSLGAGRVELGSAPDDPSEQPLPADFPTLKAGDVLLVGDLSLTLAVGEENEQDQADDSENGQTGESDGEHQDGPETGNSDENGGASLLALEAEASSPALQAQVKYEQETNGTSFEVEIGGGQPGASVDVTFAGQVLVSIQLDSLGVGTVELGSAPDDSSEQPLPADFPALKAGDVLSVGDLTLTLAVDEED